MNEGPKAITVKVKYDPNKDDTIDVKISPNTAVSDFERAIQNELRKKNINDIPVELLKFNGQELDDKKKTLEQLGIQDGSSVENENRVVFIKTLTGKTIYITFDENTTVRESLKQLKGKNPEFSYIKLVFASTLLQRSTLDQKLLGCQIGGSSIKYGAILHLMITLEANKNSDTVFDLNNLEKSKDSNYPLLRIIVGIADLLLLAAAVATFLLYFLTTLSLSVAVPIVLTVLFVVGAILFFGWNTILPKILPDNCLKKPNLENTLDEKNKDKIGEIGNNEKTNPEKKEKKDEKEEENDSL